MRACELCGSKKADDMRFAKRVACFQCIDKVLEFCITGGMKLGEGDGFESYFGGGTNSVIYMGDTGQ